MKRSITFQTQPFFYWVRKEKIENKEYVCFFALEKFIDRKQFDFMHAVIRNIRKEERPVKYTLMLYANRTSCILVHDKIVMIAIFMYMAKAEKLF